MKIVVAPTAFKHSLTVKQATRAIARGLRRAGMKDLILLPVSDGGNGFLDAMHMAYPQARLVRVRVENPIGEEVPSRYLRLPDGETAVIEMALASGIELMRGKSGDLRRMNTYGTGQLINDALWQGAKRVIIGMGGSATVDGGAGALRALGVQYWGEDGVYILPRYHHARHVYRINTGFVPKAWRKAEFIYAVDVDNPPLGERGAVPTFAPQKGATPDMMVELERDLVHFLRQLTQYTGKNMSYVEGGGSAGGLAAGLKAVLGGDIRNGFAVYAEHTKFLERCAGAKLLLTGEGKLDMQTLGGKAPYGVAQVGAQLGIATIAFTARFEGEPSLFRDAGFADVIPIVPSHMTSEEGIARAPELLERAAYRLGVLL